LRRLKICLKVSEPNHLKIVSRWHALVPRPLRRPVELAAVTVQVPKEACDPIAPAHQIFFN
jgi:hypothetical protein